MTLTVGSLFSGIGGFDLGFERAGMRVLWQCEKDKAAAAVLARRFGATIYDDVTAIGAGAPTVDVICGGFPCQDVSVAGRRAGLAGKRSGLWFEFHRILAELRPRWVVVENVPGLLSSNAGRDFAVILHGLGQLGYLSAWRVLDSQFFGVAQRRRRVFVVASLGNGRAAEVLFEREGVPGDTAPRRETREDASAVAGTLSANHGGTDRPTGNANELDFCIPFDLAQITSAANRTRAESGLPASTLNQNGQMHVAGTLTNNGKAAGSATQQDAETGMLVARSLTARQTRLQGDADNFVTHSLRAEGHDASEDGTGRTGVRRLMPVECERLQGFPDGWTDEQADSARYRQLGNAVTVNVAEWLGRRIMAVENA